MGRMVKILTEELAGPALIWAIDSIDGDRQPMAGQLQLFAEIDADHLIEKYGVWVERGYSYPWLADATHDPCNRQPGDTREVAVCRAVVFALTGTTVSVPAELIQL